MMWSFVAPVIAIICVCARMCMHLCIHTCMHVCMHVLVIMCVDAMLQVNTVILVLAIVALVRVRLKGGAEKNVKKIDLAA